MSDSLYRSRPLVLLGVLTFWAVCLIDGMPASNLVHEELSQAVNPMLYRTSLWQNDWALFAPDIDHYNSKLECTVTWDDGTQTTWTHPDWTTASWTVRFRHFRRMEFYEHLILDRGRQAWPAFANVKVQELAKASGKTPRLAELTYYGDTIAPPQELWRKAYSSPQFEPPLKFYTWYPNAISESEIKLFGN